MDEKQRLLYKFSKRQCSPEELRQLFKFLQEDTAFGHEKVMDEVWQELQTYPLLESSVSEAMYERIQNRIQSEEPSFSPFDLPFIKRRQFFLFSYGGAALKTAAAFAGILLSAWLLYLFVLKTDRIKYETTFGTTTTIELPDHSVVTLNGNSRIHYRKEWEHGQEREVWLEGEAFFSVSQTADRQKFVVHTSNINIEVLGTEFNVNNRRGQTKVTLNSGVVRLNGKAAGTNVKDVIMHPGEQASLNEHQDFQVRKVDTRQYTTWKDNVMIFDHTPVEEIAIMIEETYGLKVVLRSDFIGYMELSGSLPANDINALLGMLRETLDLEVTSNDNQVIISKK